MSKTRKNVRSRRNRRKSTKSRCRKYRYTRKGGIGPKYDDDSDSDYSENDSEESRLRKVNNLNKKLREVVRERAAARNQTVGRTGELAGPVITEKESKEYYDLMKASSRASELAEKQISGSGINKEEFKEYFDLMDAKLKQKRCQRCHEDLVEFNKMREENLLRELSAYDFK